ncbi:hypothetical protein D3C71_2168340 [compost metagenome]
MLRPDRSYFPVEPDQVPAASVGFAVVIADFAFVTLAFSALTVVLSVDVPRSH